MVAKCFFAYDSAVSVEQVKKRGEKEQKLISVLKLQTYLPNREAERCVRLFGRNFDEFIKSLINDGYVGVVQKSCPNYPEVVQKCGLPLKTHSKIYYLIKE